MKLHCIRVGLKSDKKDIHREVGHVKAEEEIGVMWLPVKQCQCLVPAAEAQRGKAGRVPH